MSGIFVSYSRVDRTITEELASRLRRTYGHEHVWFDENLRAGQDWWDEIVAQIDQCDVFLLLISPESLDSKYCMLELEEARKRRKHIIPVLVRARTNVPPHIKNLHMIKMERGVDVDSLTDLQAAINHARKHDTHDTRETLPARPANVTRPALVSLVPTRPATVMAASGGQQVDVLPPSHIGNDPVADVQHGHGAWRWGVLIVLALGLVAWWVLGSNPTQATPSSVQNPTPLVVLSQPTETEQTTALIVEQSPTEPPAVGVAAESTATRGLMLYYDDTSLILVNTGENPLSASGLIFQQGDLRYTSDTWNNGNPLGNLASGECVHVWTTSVRYLPSPSECDKRLRWRQSSKLYWFWLGDSGATFDVLRGDAVVATCAIDAGECAIP